MWGGWRAQARAAVEQAKVNARIPHTPVELAAARAHVLGLAEILSLVEQRLELLRRQPASDAARAALATLVEWSYDLLHADEKSLLHQVAVHRGGASLPSLVAPVRATDSTRQL